MSVWFPIDERRQLKQRVRLHTVLLVALCGVLAWVTAGSCRKDVHPPVTAPPEWTPSPVTPFHPVVVTAYRARPEETDNTPCRTADGTEICRRPPLAPPVCAVSPDLLARWPFGTTLEVSLLGGFWRSQCEVHDVTNARLFNRVDVLIPDGVRPDRFSGQARAVGKGERQ